jgi:hypothetical protein
MTQRINPFLNNDNDNVNVNDNDGERVVVVADEENQQLLPNRPIYTRIWLVTCLAATITILLVYGMIDLYKAPTIIYGAIGFWAFQIYYIIHVAWYVIFLIIHAFLMATQLFYTMNTANYVAHLIINYTHLRYTVMVKMSFMLALFAILFLRPDSSPTIPLYYNVIMLEVILSLLLVVVINDVIAYRIYSRSLN